MAMKKILSDFHLTDKERKNIEILSMIRRSGPIARTDISKTTKINIVTVSHYVDNYIRRGLVVEKGQDISSGGRKPLLVDLSAGNNFVLGIGLNVNEILGIVVDLKGKIMWKLEKPRPVEKPDPALIEIMAELTAELLDIAKIDKSNIRGIGIGVPGIIDKEGHTIRCPGSLGTSDVYVTIPVRDIFEKRFKIPSLIENDAGCAVFAEKWFGGKPNVKDMIYMFSAGGSGIMINGQIYRGFKGYAGELGIHNYNEGSLETWTQDSFHIGRCGIDLGLSSQARRGFEENRNSKIFQLVNNDLGKISFKTILDAAATKDKFAISLLEMGGLILGKKVAFLVNFMNPQIIVIGGGVEEGGAVFLDSLKKTVKAWSVEEATRDLKIIPSQLGSSAVSLGAAGLVIQNIFAHA